MNFERVGHTFRFASLWDSVRECIWTGVKGFRSTINFVQCFPVFQIKSSSSSLFPIFNLFPTSILGVSSKHSPNDPRLSTINRATATEPKEEEEIIRSKRRHHNLRVQVEPLDLTKPLDVEPLRKGMHAWLHSEEDSHVKRETLFWNVLEWWEMKEAGCPDIDSFDWVLLLICLYYIGSIIHIFPLPFAIRHPPWSIMIHLGKIMNELTSWRHCKLHHDPLAALPSRKTAGRITRCLISLSSWRVRPWFAAPGTSTGTASWHCASMGPPHSTWRRSVRHWALRRRSKKVPWQRLQGTEVGAFPGVESRVSYLFNSLRHSGPLSFGIQARLV